MRLKIDSIGGMCPVQAEGTVGGFPFYFRARHTSWEFAVAEKGKDPVDVCCDPAMKGFYRAEPWGDGPHDAGYMPVATATRIIRICAREFAAVYRRHLVRMFWNRLTLFCGIVFRPIDSQLWEATPFPQRLLTLMWPRHAWDIAKTVHD